MVIKHAEIMDNRAAVVDIEGPLDSYTSPDFEGYVNRLLEKRIVFILFDAGRMEYVSSEGIGLLLFLQKKIAEANGSFVIFNLTDEITSLYTLLGFNRIFRIAGSREEALRVMERQIDRRDRGLGDEEPAEAPEEPAVTVVSVPEPAEVETVRPAPAPAQTAGPAARSKVVSCATCRAKVRVYHDGDYLCPHCGTEFSVSGLETENEKRAAAPATGDADFGQLIIECGKCRSLIRVKKPGAYQCADCGATFSVSPDQAVKF